MKKANCKSGCTSSCPCQCVRPKRRRARPNTAPRRNPIADLVTALLTQKLQEGINKPPMFKPEPVEKKSVATSTEPVRTATTGTLTEQSIRQSMGSQTRPERVSTSTSTEPERVSAEIQTEPPERVSAEIQTEPERAAARTQTEPERVSAGTSTLPTNAEPVVEAIVKERRQKLYEPYPSDAERRRINKEVHERQVELGMTKPLIPKEEERKEEDLGAMKGKALEELRKKVKAEPKIKTIEDFFKPSAGGRSGDLDADEKERRRVDIAERSLGGGGGAGPSNAEKKRIVNLGLEALKINPPKSKQQQKNISQSLTSLLGTLQEETNKAASADGTKKVEFS